MSMHGTGQPARRQPGTVAAIVAGVILGLIGGGLWVHTATGAGECASAIVSASSPQECNLYLTGHELGLGLAVAGIVLVLGALLVRAGRR